MLRKIGFGLIPWAVPCATAIPLLPLMQSDLFFFKTIMVAEGSLPGTLLTAIYFSKVQSGYLLEGIQFAAVWIVLNWLLDFAAPSALHPTDRTAPLHRNRAAVPRDGGTTHGGGFCAAAETIPAFKPRCPGDS